LLHREGRSPGGIVEYPLLEAKGLLSLRRFEETVSACEEVLVRTPKFTAAPGMAGASYATLGEHEKAKNIFQHPKAP
jgi:hypothetical protein